MFSITFLLFHHFFRSSPPKKLQKQSPRCVLQKKVNIFREEHIWGTASGTLEIVLHYFLSVQFYSCLHFWQIYFKCFLHTALLQTSQLILTLPSLFLFSLYFSCPRISSMQMWHRFLSLAFCILTSAAFGNSPTFKTFLRIFVITVCCNPTGLAKRRVICAFKRSIPNYQMKSKVRISCLISLKAVYAFVRAVSSM